MNKKGHILLCSDLDRTILPNGKEEESPPARPLLRKIAKQLILAYVSGRDRHLLSDAISEYAIPVPDFAIGDVGTSIYTVREKASGPVFEKWEEWEKRIAGDWQGMDYRAVSEFLKDLKEIRLQAPESQNTYKLSYFSEQISIFSEPGPAETRCRTAAELIKEIDRRLTAQGVKANIIWSVDDMKGVGLLDIIPEKATKFHAVNFLKEKLGIEEERVVYAGDSGNDLPALTGGLQAVLVKNAAEEVRQMALAEVKRKGNEEKLYLARGNFFGMNGNYAAGALEGLCHFLPETETWMKSGLQEIENGG
ncbi:MAG: HAD-IIB family hydrolase [Desulfococcaceae bacterium]|jgi:HAD superfamily hydrolase (TIGR01484 family)|nr:HAD-IIB family hydrolase [Desulfococcaceae bacterium]